MVLDATATKNLELVKTSKDNKKYGSLLWVLDKTETGMGARTLQSWLLSPLQDVKKINERLDAVEKLFTSSLTRQSISEL
ncbi:MAG: hypothetical protein MJ072_05310, partial [Clostridia bacterium]|nr:hypothetical protein [Clostridia bacterium]